MTEGINSKTGEPKIQLTSNTTGKSNPSDNVIERQNQKKTMVEPNKFVDMVITEGTNSKTGEPKI